MIFKFKITGKDEEVVEFEKKLIDILLKTINDNELTAHEIRFCVHEAVLNVIQHTYKWDLSQSIEIKIDVLDIKDNKQIIEIFIKDFGKPVNTDIRPPDHIKQFQLRKRGLYMISKIMDEFYIEPQEKTGNITYMKKVIFKKEIN